MDPIIDRIISYQNDQIYLITQSIPSWSHQLLGIYNNREEAIRDYKQYNKKRHENGGARIFAIPRNISSITHHPHYILGLIEPSKFSSPLDPYEFFIELD